MIQANELRIGNLVYEKHCDDSLHIAVVALIQKYGDATKIRTENGWYAEEPIPLTEEWLIKFGFVSSMFEDNVFIHYNGMKYFLETQQLHFLTIELNFKYVHILQNIYFALTGEELTIKE